MRRRKRGALSEYKILILDDEIGIIDSVAVMLRRSGYHFTGVTDPLEAIERLRTEHYDMLILDYLMQPIHGDQVVERIREFNSSLYILLLTGHKDLVPPLETIKALDIQGYCEKSDKFDQLLLLIESGIKSISQMRTINKFKDGLNNILQAVPKIYQLQPIGQILEEILAQTQSIVKYTDGFIFVDDAKSLEPHKNMYKGIGKFDSRGRSFIDMLGPGLVERISYARASKEVVRLDDGIIFPLINEFAEAIGVLYVEGEAIDEGGELLEIYSRQAATSINNALLHSIVHSKNNEINHTYDQLKIRYLETIEALRLTVDTKDVYTRGHSDRVAYYAVKLGQQFGLSDKELETLRVAGVFHDVGKIGLADEILLKQGKLTRSEYEEIKKHPAKGAHILSAISMFKDIVPLVKYHHERFDGKGYPEGLKGHEIPFFARILTVADAFDAMTSDRQYRRKLTLEQAREQLISGSGSQFDKDVVAKMLILLENYDDFLKESGEAYA